MSQTEYVILHDSAGGEPPVYELTEDTDRAALFAERDDAKVFARIDRDGSLGATTGGP